MADRSVFPDEDAFYRNFYGSEGPMLSYEVAFRILYPFSERWSIGAGIAYSRKGYQRYGSNEHGVLAAFKRIINNKGLFFLETPVFMRYDFIENEKIQLYGQAGLSASIYTHERRSYWMDGEVVEFLHRNSNIRPVNMGAHIGAGIQFALVEPWQFGVETNYSNHLFFLDRKELKYNHLLYSYGFSMVVKRSLRAKK